MKSDVDKKTTKIQQSTGSVQVATEILFTLMPKFQDWMNHDVLITEAIIKVSHVTTVESGE